MNKKFWKFKNEAEEAADLLLYGPISEESWLGDEVTPKAFAEDLALLGGKALNVHINSPGGDVFAAQAIYNQLKAYKADVTVYIDGMAASAATLIACAGDVVIMPSNAIYMIHNPATVAAGDADTMKQAAKVLDKVKDTIVNVYANRVGDRLSETKIKHMMDAETWMTAKEAFENGFVDVVDSLMPVSNTLSGNMLVVNSVSCDLSKYRNSEQIVEILEGKGRKKGRNDMKDSELLEKIKSMLGLGGETPSEPKQEDAAVVAERSRIQALDVLNAKNSRHVAKMLNIAKNNGMTAEEVKPFIDIVNEVEEKAVMIDYMKKMVQDNLASGAESVKPAPQANDPASEKQQAIDEIVNLANGKRG